jgi:dUTP pyrophosphatase
LIVKLKKSHPDIPTPVYKTLGSAGCDVCASEDVLIYPLETVLVGTGLFLEVPEGYECQIRTRSGLALKGITVLNSPGTLDSDYRGELKVILHNSKDDFPFRVMRGDRIAQLVFAPVYQATFEEVEELSKTERGEGGFGSTGVR